MTLSRRNLLKAGISIPAFSLLKSRAFARVQQELGLKDVFKNDFLLGTMLKPKDFMQPENDYLRLVEHEFNSLVADNTFKWAYIHPADNYWDWSYADEFVSYGSKHNMHMVGHVLVWHAQNPPSLFLKESGGLISAGGLKKKLENHIGTIVDRYRGQIHAWDVLNEAFDENGWVANKWYQAMGTEYVSRAFSIAREADHNAVLLYNDYNMSEPKRLAGVLEFVTEMKQKGVQVDAVGMQGHFTLGYPDMELFEKALVAYAQAGLKIHISELDVDILPGLSEDEFPDYRLELDLYRDGLPMEIEQKLAERYKQIFEVFLKHSDVIDRVTFWGVSDGDSWKNDFPIEGRTNYPLLFDRNLKRKLNYEMIASLKK